MALATVIHLCVLAVQEACLNLTKLQSGNKSRNMSYSNTSPGRKRSRRIYRNVQCDRRESCSEATSHNFCPLVRGLRILKGTRERDLGLSHGIHPWDVRKCVERKPNANRIAKH